MPSPPSTTRFPDLSERAGAFRAAGALVVAFCSFSVVTCASARSGPPVAASTPASSVEAETASAVAAETQFVPAPPSSSSEPVAPPVAAPELARFFRAAAALESSGRSEPVRILWLGDSHTAADFWTDAVREPLQERFGNAGPGFVHVGLKAYRHSGVSVATEGRWFERPRAPSFWERQEDGVFGLGGLRAVPVSSASRTTIKMRASAAKALGTAKYDVAFRVPGGQGALGISFDGHSVRLDGTTAEGNDGAIHHHVFEVGANVEVTIRGLHGRPELLGVIIEGTKPGIVIDTLGINGARIATPLAWDEAAWVAEARRRGPSLLILAYGTNEVGDSVAPWRYGQYYDELVNRVRLASPEVDCLIIGPTDRALPDWSPHPRVLELEAVERQAASRLGCHFWSAIDAMGGPGSLVSWARQSPALASADRVHLTIAGYEKLGEALAKALLGAYVAAGHGR